MKLISQTDPVRGRQVFAAWRKAAFAEATKRARDTGETHVIYKRPGPATRYGRGRTEYVDYTVEPLSGSLGLRPGRVAIVDLIAPDGRIASATVEEDAQS